MKKKIILTIIDGLGIRKEIQGNAYAQAHHPTFDNLFKNYPNSIIAASGEAVGLPENQIGNSEVGHLNIGAGRVVYTGLSLINEAIRNHSFYENEVLNLVIDETKRDDKTLHIMGLLSNGGVHSLDLHLFKILKLAHQKHLKKVSVHIFGDGRDVKPKSIQGSLDKLSELVNEYGYKISSISGRFYAMDRDKIFERNLLSYETILGISKNKFDNINEYVQSQYSQDILDEFFIPAQSRGGWFLEDGDSVIFFNFRPDRARQLSHLIIGSKLYDYKPTISKKIKNFVSLMKYEGIDSKIAFEEMKVVKPLGEILETNKITQLRLAETQKYAHVTFFFDGGVDKVYKNENRILVNSIKAESFADYPHMSAKEITDELINSIDKNDFVIMNYANPDMVGHTGNLKATIEAIEFLDKQFARILDLVQKREEITWFITADHGNAEITEDNSGKPATKHTTSPVMLISTDKNIKLNDGKLADIAPTILEYIGIEKPEEMTGKSLLK
ncbi:2,3-bisphosphoglycerate-independent phosphoglycerate mutase [Mycoplasma phocoeninasale]|uniref:2,3-bisphosphoglycerate-independent phosphoglycerate mutase n=1 Tax=Mycoplasma phocoeninasale TaxID=2726117 RepID=UPI001967A72D|nr:2,3-bisphosphoglycerate-independent phosphoglycerate mutase [Mycoplasma phocoeninasale]MBN0970553.1 2,3-bisphosphoglycerate-independent phosphoglycerate mutase [Mycoplasma phocoeninasale]